MLSARVICLTGRDVFVSLGGRERRPALRNCQELGGRPSPARACKHRTNRVGCLLVERQGRRGTPAARRGAGSGPTTPLRNAWVVCQIRFLDRMLTVLSLSVTPFHASGSPAQKRDSSEALFGPKASAMCSSRCARAHPPHDTGAGLAADLFRDLDNGWAGLVRETAEDPDALPALPACRRVKPSCGAGQTRRPPPRQRSPQSPSRPDYRP
jgi:hypothetical protein